MRPAKGEACSTSARKWPCSLLCQPLPLASLSPPSLGFAVLTRPQRQELLSIRKVLTIFFPAYMNCDRTVGNSLLSEAGPQREVLGRSREAGTPSPARPRPRTSASPSWSQPQVGSSCMPPRPPPSLSIAIHTRVSRLSPLPRLLSLLPCFDVNCLQGWSAPWLIKSKSPPRFC